MAAELGLYLQKAMERQFVFGEHDCMLFPAGWGWQVTGHDPAALWRGQYRNEDSAARIVARAGGMQSLMDHGVASVGGRSVGPPYARPGSVGVVLAGTADGLKPTGAIRTSTGWAVLTDKGIAVGQFLALAAWEFV